MTFVDEECILGGPLALKSSKDGFEKREKCFVDLARWMLNGWSIAFYLGSAVHAKWLRLASVDKGVLSGWFSVIVWLRVSPLAITVLETKLPLSFPNRRNCRVGQHG